jgi:Ca2+-binding EF-hand superfamily protein
MRLRTQTLGISIFCLVAAAVVSAQAPAKKTNNPGSNPDREDGRQTQGFDASRFLKDHDKNKDGKLSKDELPLKAQEEFAKIDANKDNAISTEELQQYANHVANRRPQLIEVIYYAIDIPDDDLTMDELQAAYEQLRKLDKDNDGKLTDQELKAVREERRKERVDNICQTLDTNKDGKLSKDEARGTWAENFAELDKNSDGSLDKEEIDAACLKRKGLEGKTGTKNN